jgi:uncharacterized protein (DUF433 family)
MSDKSVIYRSPEVQGGTPVFMGTRVPVKTLLDYFEAGDCLDDFLQEYPSVTREQALAVLEIAKEALLVDSNEAAA